jgi:Flp pilus assembly protein TadG
MVRSVRVRSARRSGIAAVEAAVALPIVLIFLVAVADLGRVPKIADSVSNAARNAAQYGSLTSTTAADTAGIRAAALTEMANLPKVTGTNPTVTSQTVTNSGMQYMKVTVTYDMTGTAFFNWFPVTSMSRTVQMPMMPQ